MNERMKANFTKKDVQKVLSLDIKCESCGVAHLFFYNIKESKPRCISYSVVSLLEQLLFLF